MIYLTHLLWILNIFFTADMSQFSKENYVASVSSFYREAISHNFASYLSRIGIPVEKKDDVEGVSRKVCK